jgi:hypothetical protein
MHVLLIFCNLGKVYDCVNHEMLLAKLHLCSIRGVNSDWFRPCLTKGKQTVAVKLRNATSLSGDH